MKKLSIRDNREAYLEKLAENLTRENPTVNVSVENETIQASRDGYTASYPIWDIEKDDLTVAFVANTLSRSIEIQSITDPAERRHFILSNVIAIPCGLPESTDVTAQINGVTYRFLAPVNPGDKAHCIFRITRELMEGLAIGYMELAFHAGKNTKK